MIKHDHADEADHKDFVMPHEFMCDQALDELVELLAPLLAQFGQTIPNLGKFKVLLVAVCAAMMDVHAKVC